MWKYVRKLTPHAKCQTSKQVPVHELPCFVRNNEELSEDYPNQDIVTSNDVPATFSTSSDSGLVDSTDELALIKSCLRFTHFSPTPPDPKRAKSWKKSQPYHVPSISPKLWIVICKLVGIPLHENDKPWLSTILHILTWASAICFTATRTWHIGYGILGSEEKRNVLKGCVGIVMGIFWGLLAIYANNLAYRMFTHQTFVKNIRMHSKTILKCKAAYLVIICGILFTSLSNLSAKDEFDSTSCELINLDPIVCWIMFTSRAIFSCFAFLWNTIVAVVVLSVCRTHALAIRQFIRELEHDAFACDDLHRRTFSTSTVVTDVSCFMEEIDDDIESNSSLEEVNENGDSLSRDVEHRKYSSILSPNDVTHRRHGGTSNYRSADVDSNLSILKQSEILHRYWKLQCSLRLSSSAFKRWLLCFMCLCIIWVGICLVAWLSQEPSVLDVALFVIPIIWLPVMASGVAEVNNEGNRMLRFLSPSEERLKLLLFLHEAPLQMTIYGFAIKYSTVVTTLFGLVAAIMSGVIMQEIKNL